MDQYKISQNPSTSSKKAPKKKGVKVKARPRTKAPKQRNTRSLSPQLVLGGIVLVMVMILAGVAWAHFFSKSSESPATGSPAVSVKKGGNSGSSGVVPAETFGAVTAAIGDKRTSTIDKYYAKNVHVIIKKRGVNQNVSGKTVGSLINDVLNTAETPWDWHVSPTQLSAWQQGPQGQYFTGNVIVGISNDGTVVSIELNDAGEIITVFIAPVGDLTTPATTSPTATTPGSDGTTPTTPDSTPVVSDTDAD
jgi:hypothetical protein